MLGDRAECDRDPCDLGKAPQLCLQPSLAGRAPELRRGPKAVLRGERPWSWHRGPCSVRVLWAPWSVAGRGRPSRQPLNQKPETRQAQELESKGHQ